MRDKVGASAKASGAQRNSAGDAEYTGTAGHILLRTNPTGGGGFVIGTFIADATGIQNISVYGNRNSDLTQNLSANTGGFNALQLRAIPEPATLGLFGVFGGTMFFIRRHFRA